MSRAAARPWIWSFVGAAVVWLAAIAFTGGYGAAGMISAALALALFMVVVGVGQMFVISLGPGNVDLSIPANIGLASAVAMKVMGGADAMIAVGLFAGLGSGVLIGIANYLLIWALRIPPIIATLSASFIIQSIGIAYGRGLQIKPPPSFADFANWQLGGVSVLAILTVAFTVGAGILLQRTIYGRSVLAIGQNMRAAWLAGVRVGRVRFLTYVLSGALAGLTAHCWRVTSAALHSTSAMSTCSLRSRSWSSAALRSPAARPTCRASGAPPCSWSCCLPCSIPLASVPACGWSLPAW